MYTQTLNAPHVKPDIAFWLNHYLGTSGTALNCAVEESTLRQRQADLLEHDEFIRDHITENDILIVSVGGNDIALKPTIPTIICLLILAWLTPKTWLEKGKGWPFIASHFVRLFKDQVETYVGKIVEKKKPRCVVVCMIYYPLEKLDGGQSSWADVPLRFLGYNIFPGRLQAAIRGTYEVATRQVRIDGTDVRGCKLFDFLDEKDRRNYESRVEPSVEGGRKMAEGLMGIVNELWNGFG